MLQKVEMYTVVCDNCGVDIGVTQEYSCWNDELYAQENAMENEWLKEGDKHYCPKCYSYDDDNLIIRAIEKSSNKLGEGEVAVCESCNKHGVVNWVAIDDEKPNDERWILAANIIDGWVDRAEYNEEQGYWFNGEVEIIPTHWAELPEPPCL